MIGKLLPFPSEPKVSSVWLVCLYSIVFVFSSPKVVRLAGHYYGLRIVEAILIKLIDV